MSREANAARLRAWMLPRVRPADIARTGNFSRSYVAKVLAGERPPSARFVAAARELGIPIDTLLPGLDDERAA